MTRRDPLGGFVPRRPPAELRERVLGAAREAAGRKDMSTIDAILADRALRWCGAAVLALLIANAFAGGAATPPLRSTDSIALPDVGSVPVQEHGQTAREQAQSLASLLGGRESE